MSLTAHGSAAISLSQPQHGALGLLFLVKALLQKGLPAAVSNEVGAASPRMSAWERELVPLCPSSQAQPVGLFHSGTCHHPGSAGLYMGQPPAPKLWHPWGDLVHSTETLGVRSGSKWAALPIVLPPSQCSVCE